MTKSFRFSSLILAFSALTALGAVGCSSADDPNQGETGEDAAELKSNPNSGYFIVTRPDYRRCMYPLCGGYYVRRINQTLERYVSDFDFEALALNETDRLAFQGEVTTGKAIVKGELKGVPWNGTSVNKFVASEGWHGATGNEPTGTSYRITDSGIRCIVAPCPSLHEGKLNSSQSKNIHDLDLSVTSDQALVDSASSSIYEDGGILVAGVHARVSGQGGKGSKLVASEFYLRVKPSPVEPVARLCGSRGLGPCNDGEFCQFEEAAACGTWDAPGTCVTAPTICIKIFRPVCGCDGQTYGNSCQAHAASTSVAYEGECSP